MKEPLVLIHGCVGASWRDFAPVLPLLEEQRELVVLRTPGHYEAEPLPDSSDLSFEAFADLLEQELDAHDLNKPDIIGDSTGGLLALELARRGRARAVVAISPGGMWNEKEARKMERDLRLGYRMARRMLPFAVMIAKTATGRYLIFSPMLGTRGARLDGEEAAHVLRALADSTLPIDFIDANKDKDGNLHTVDVSDEIRCPVLFLWGEKDRLLPVKQGRRWADAIPGAELRELAGVGHHPHFDEPERVCELALAFLDRAGAREGQALTA